MGGGSNPLNPPPLRTPMSMTNWSSNKTAKLGTQTKPHDSVGLFSFLMPKTMAKVQWRHLKWGRHKQVGRLKLTTF